MTEPRLAADAPPNCDTEGCKNAAVATYVWDWGQQGVCCPLHQMLLTQKQEALGRRVSFSPFGAVQPAPLLRDERVRLTAEVLVGKEELEEAKLRGLDLYRENVLLTKQVQSLTVRGREVEAQLKDAQTKVGLLDEKLAERDVELAELTDEVTRLRTLASFVDTPTEPSRLQGFAPQT